MASSLARLHQVTQQPRVLNIGLADAGSLKPPRNLQRAPTRMDGAGMTQIPEGMFTPELSNEMQSYRQLSTSPPLMTTSYQQAAWFVLIIVLTLIITLL